MGIAFLVEIFNRDIQRKLPGRLGETNHHWIQGLGCGVKGYGVWLQFPATLNAKP